jgi:pimeloyl-ACP methyl ester carboxylesterase
MSLDYAPASGSVLRVGSESAHGVHRGGVGEPLALTRGFSGTRLMREAMLEALERSHDVRAVNLAGHVGGPGLAATSVSVDALVDAVERDLDAAGFAHVVGNSLGGWIAFDLATRGRARSVVALAPAGGWEPGSRAERRLRTLFIRNHKLSTALLPRIDSLMRRPRLRRALLWQLAAHGASGSSCQGSATSRCSPTRNSWRGRSPSSWAACANRLPSAAPSRISESVLRGEWRPEGRVRRLCGGGVPRGRVPKSGPACPATIRRAAPSEAHEAPSVSIVPPPVPAELPPTGSVRIDRGSRGRAGGPVTVVAPRETMDVEKPFTGEMLGRVPRCEEDDVQRAVLEARAAQARWASTSLGERSAIFRRFHDLVLRRQDEVLDLIQLESGKARRHASEEVLDVAIVSRYYANTAERYLRSQRRRGALPLLTATWEHRHPLGVVGIIGPWNYPLTLGITDRDSGADRGQRRGDQA